MGIRQRGDRWLVTVENGRDPHTYGRRRICRTVDSFDAAKRLEAKLKTSVYEGTHIKPATETLGEFSKRWLASIKHDVEASTYDTYTTQTAKHIVGHLGKVPLSKLKTRTLDEWKTKLLDSGLSTTTVRKQYWSLNDMLDLAVTWGLLATNPLQGVTAPVNAETTFHVYTPAEQDALLAAAAPNKCGTGNYHTGRSEGRALLPIVVELGTGLRLSELLALKRTDIDCEHGWLYVRHGKTRSARRQLPLAASLSAALSAHLERTKPHRHGLLFPTAAGDPWTASGFKSSWRRVRVRAAQLMVEAATKAEDEHALHAGDGILSGRFHDLRHTYATERLRDGVPLKVVSQLLGHSTIAITADTYQHVMSDMADAASASVERHMSGLVARYLPPKMIQD